MSEQNAQYLKTRSVRRERELESARRISESLFQQNSVDSVVERALLTALQVVDATAGSVVLVEKESGQLIFRYSVGENTVPPGTAIPVGEGIASSVFKSNQPAIIADAQTAFQDEIAPFVRDFILDSS